MGELDLLCGNLLGEIQANIGQGTLLCAALNRYVFVLRREACNRLKRFLLCVILTVPAPYPEAPNPNVLSQSCFIAVDTIIG